MTRSRVSKGLNNHSLILALAMTAAIAAPVAANSSRDATTKNRPIQAGPTVVVEVPNRPSDRPSDSLSEMSDSGLSQIAIPQQNQTLENQTPKNQAPATEVQPKTETTELEQPSATETQQTTVVEPARTPTVKVEQTAEPVNSESEPAVISEPAETSESTPLETTSEESVQGGPTSEEIVREKQLIEADTLYLEGKVEDAEALYRQAKDPFTDTEQGAWQLPDPITDAELLSTAGRVYWREAERGMARELEISSLVPLRLLVDKNPEFVPGHLKLAEALEVHAQPDEALAVMASAASLYPSQPDLQKGLIDRQVASKRWLEASITARQFAVLNPEHPDAPELLQASEEYQERFRSYLREQMTSNMISGVLGGALGVALTGNPFMALPTVQSSLLMLRGESAVGESATKSFKKRLDLIEDPDVQAYVDRIGQKLAQIGGRDFEYEFFVVKDEDLNAFALPGGKVFINGGAIVKSNSEAELAGLMAHELAHAILSHGFQSVTQSTATASFTRLIPYVGGLATRLAVADYSRDMEEQADLLGTRMLVSAGYAADGLRNLMVTLAQEDKETPFHWLSTHPKNKERISYLETLVERNGYSRYRYEGIAEHKQIKERVQALLKAEDTEENIDKAVEEHKDKTPPSSDQLSSSDKDKLPDMPAEGQLPDVQGGE